MLQIGHIEPCAPIFPERRREYLRGIADEIVLGSIRCRLMGPTSLALDLTDTRSPKVMRYEVIRFINAKLVQTAHPVLGTLANLSDEDFEYITKALPLLADALWARVIGLLK